MKAYALPAAFLMAATLALNTGCRKEGPAEKAGKTLDGTENHPIRDAVEPDGIGEKAGKKIDKGVDDAGKSLDAAGKKIDKAVDKAAN